MYALYALYALYASLTTHQGFNEMLALNLAEPQKITGRTSTPWPSAAVLQYPTLLQIASDSSNVSVIFSQVQTGEETFSNAASYSIMIIILS